MTDKERLERERDWVEARFRCTVDTVFKTLIAVIESDIGSFSKLSGNNDCEIKHVDDRNVTFSRMARVSTVSTNGRDIRAKHEFNGCELFKIEIASKWNEADMQCDLFIEGQKVSMHRASQKIIGSVLFS